MSGGDFGVEASLTGVIVLVAALLVAWRAFQNRPAVLVGNADVGQSR